MDKEELLKLEGEEKEEEIPEAVEEPRPMEPTPESEEVPAPIPEEIHEEVVEEKEEVDSPAENAEELAPEPTEPTQPEGEPTGTSPEENAEANNPYRKTFTQEDVDKLVGETRVKTREKTFRYIFDRYGVKDESELDDLVAQAQCYDTFKEESDAEKASWEQERNDRDARLTSMSEEIALMKSGIDADRYEDAKLILRGKGLEVTLENINAELATHPEWKKVDEKEEVGEVAEESTETSQSAPAQEPEAPKVTTRITTLGNEPKPVAPASEEEQAEKLFKMKFRG